MYLFFTALVSLSGSAHADPIYGPGPGAPGPAPSPIPGIPGGCGTRPPPCIGVYQGDFTIVPPDWYFAAERALEGRLNSFRVEVFTTSGDFDVQVGGRWLSEAYFSEKESGRTEVYYVPAFEGAEVTFKDFGREASVFEIQISGSELSFE